jgi:GNAT superfamily N-acetyltransferase
MEFTHYSIASSAPETIATQSSSLIEQITKADQHQFPDRFKNYNFRDPSTAAEYYSHRTRQLVSQSGDGWHFVFGNGPSEDSVAVAAHQSEWDESHFGKKMASLQFLSVPGQSRDTCAAILREAISILRVDGVEFVSARTGTEFLSAIHACEEVGFRYYETVIWALVPTLGLVDVPGVRLMNPGEIDEVADLAAASQFRGGHFYLDSRFDGKVVNSMYSKWVRTHAGRGDPIAVIDGEKGIAGFFAFALDESLSEYSGYSYAHLQLLALNAEERGRGIGRQLFQGTLTLIASMGVDFIDTGYASRNHKSARLHTISNFHSVYDELTFHLWLSDKNDRN